MSSDQHCGSQPIELQKEMQKTFCQNWIDVSRRLVGQEKLGLRDNGAGNCSPLLFAP